MPSALSLLLELEGLCFDHPYTAEQLELMLEDRLYCTLFVDAKGTVGTASDDPAARPVGYLIACLSELHRIAILPDWREKGLASNLLNEWIARCASEERLLLEVASKNETAIAFYRRHGFTLIGSRKRYYADGDDALLYERLPSTEDKSDESTHRA